MTCIVSDICHRMAPFDFYCQGQAFSWYAFAIKIVQWMSQADLPRLTKPPTLGLLLRFSRLNLRSFKKEMHNAAVN